MAMLALPPPPSWYPGHMAAFAKALPSLLPKTHVVLEVRDIRLPLTSINPQLENALAQWRGNGRGAGKACEHVVVYSKRDLVPSWGEERLRRGLSSRFDQTIHFTSPASLPSIRALHKTLVSIAKQNEQTLPELNVLVVGMPNVGKSTLLNSLRGAGISGPGSRHPLLTSAMPGHTKKLSNRLKLSTTHPIYAIDSPGVMIPFFGHGDEGKERGVRLALSAGIKESLYDEETLVSYLLWALWRENPSNPVFAPLLHASDAYSPSSDFDFASTITSIARRMGAVRSGGELDLSRASQHVIRWWREGKHVSSSDSEVRPHAVRGWGLDFYFRGRDIPLTRLPPAVPAAPVPHLSGHASTDPLQDEMNLVIDRFLDGLRGTPNGLGVSNNQLKKKEKEMKKLERERRKAAGRE